MMENFNLDIPDGVTIDPNFKRSKEVDEMMAEFEKMANILLRPTPEDMRIVCY